MFAEANAPYPNRIQLLCTPFVGPFVQNGPLGAFNPIRDIQVWVDGVLLPIQTWAFDAGGNRYLIYMSQAIDLKGVIQLIHHVPSPPFTDAGSQPLSFLLQEDDFSLFYLESTTDAILLETDAIVIGFALITGYSSLGDIIVVFDGFELENLTGYVELENGDALLRE